MNAAKKIRRFIEEGKDPDQLKVLKELAAALEMGRSFDLSALYEIDMRYFDVAIELLRDWRFDHHIAARSKLLEHLLTEIAPEQQAPVTAEDVVNATATAAEQDAIQTEDAPTAKAKPARKPMATAKAKPAEDA